MTSVARRARRAQRQLERHAINPVMRVLLRAGVAPTAFALLETTGRRSGLPRQTPVGGHLERTTYWLVAQRGDDSDYVKNLLANPLVRLKIRNRWHLGSATLLPGDDGLARRRQLDRANKWIGRADGLIFRAGAHDPRTIRIDLDASPRPYGTNGAGHSSQRPRLPRRRR
jgi:deazaflavin-dependent oxidoreductase (nitroreductase family)